jgi:hypothetical protein
MAHLHNYEKLFRMVLDEEMVKVHSMHYHMQRLNHETSCSTRSFLPKRLGHHYRKVLSDDYNL